MKILFSQIKIFYRVVRNYRKMCKRKNIFFFLYIFPPIGFILYKLFLKPFILSKNEKLINKYFKNKIFKTCIRFFTINERYKLSRILYEYNDLIVDEIDQSSKLKVEKLENDGYCSIGKFFSDVECKDFLNFLEGKNCYTNQVPLQSNGQSYQFKFDKFNKENSNYPYIVFLPEIINYKPIQRILLDNKIKNIIDSYLKFKWTIYSCITWFNPKSDKKHYVHRFHRDHDDYKSLTMFIYWTEVDDETGCFNFIKGSHKNNDNNNTKLALTGKKGEVFFADTSGLHCASQIKKNFRFLTQIRFGKSDGYSAVVDGFCQSPTKKELSFLEIV